MGGLVPKNWKNFLKRRGGAHRGGVWGGSTPPPPEIPKAVQNLAKLNPIVKTVTNC